MIVRRVILQKAVSGMVFIENHLIVHLMHLVRTGLDSVKAVIMILSMAVIVGLQQD